MVERSKPPSLLDVAKLPGPVFLRKINKKSDWNSDSPISPDRVATVVEHVFNIADYPYSVFRVSTDDELRRVVMGMNGNRDHPSSDSFYVAIQPQDLELVEIRATHSPDSGLTLCRIANSLHYDLVADRAQLQRLCLYLLESDRKASSLTKPKTAAIIATAESEGCLAIRSSTTCSVAEC